MSAEQRDEQEFTAQMVAHLAGAMSAEERLAFEATLAAEPALAARYRVVAASRDELAAAEMRERDAWSPGAFGLRRLMRDIETETPQKTAATQLWSSVAVWRSVAAAAAAALLVVSLWRVDGDASRDGGLYTPSSLAQAAIAPVQITFRPGATESEIRSTLLDADATLIGGPTALGVYFADFKSVQARDIGIAKMRGAAVVEFVAAEKSGSN